MASLGITLVTEDTNIEFGFDTYLADATNQNITLTLPEVFGDGPNFIISRIDNSVNTVTIISITSGVTINGSSSIVLNAQENVRLAMYADNWYTIQGVIGL